jgi:hypothetical protein
MTERLFVTALFGAFIWINAGCGRNAIPDIADQDQLTLYSIDGKRFGPGKNPDAAETFYEYPVLGHIDMIDGQQRRDLLAALRNGLNEGKQTAKCFWPRHGIRIVSHGKTTDYLICFECSHVYIYSDVDVAVKPIERSHQAVFDELLKDASIPLAP